MYKKYVVHTICWLAGAGFFCKWSHIDNNGESMCALYNPKNVNWRMIASHFMRCSNNDTKWKVSDCLPVHILTVTKREDTNDRNPNPLQQTWQKSGKKGKSGKSGKKAPLNNPILYFFPVVFLQLCNICFMFFVLGLQLFQFIRSFFLRSLQLLVVFLPLCNI